MSHDRKQQLQDIRAVLGTAQGRRLLCRIWDESRLMKPCYTGNSNTFYNEGRRELGLTLWNDAMEACPELLLDTVAEGRKREGEDGYGGHAEVARGQH